MSKQGSYATYARIDLAALSANLQGVRQRVADRKILVAVKANAYGHGAVGVAQFLQAQELADWLGVATVPEAIELRRAGIRLPILKLSHVFADEISDALDADLTLPVAGVQSFRELSAVAAARGQVVDVHLATDTGMGRIGGNDLESVGLAREIGADPYLRLTGVFTHLPVSDTPAGAEFTWDELRTFADIVANIQTDRSRFGLPPVGLIHASNSGAILAHDMSGLTMVRPGIMVYGYYPDATTPRTMPLRPVMSLHSRVSYLKHVPAGTGISYGRTWIADTDTWIATVPVGYADGFARLNSNRGRMLIGGRSYPVVGRVCMDQTMLNLGPHTPVVRVGDEVTWLGRDGNEHIDADELAARMGTISYEMLSLITPRVTREYV